MMAQWFLKMVDVGLRLIENAGGMGIQVSQVQV